MGSNCPTSSDGNAMTMREGLASSSHRLRDRMRRRSENGIRLAAVAQDRFAGGEGRPLRTEEQAQRGHLLWLARPSDRNVLRSEEHTYELQSLLRISYADFCLQKNNKHDHMSNHYYKIYTQSKQTTTPTLHNTTE